MKPASRRELVWATAAFIALTIVFTYPQIRLLRTHMAPHYDTLFSVWRLAWIAHQLPHDPRHLFDGNIFYPEAHTLAYSDALLLPALIGAPFIWLGMPAVAVHNLLAMGSFVACGVAMYALVRELTGSVPAAWFAALVFAFQPYRFGHYAQLELLWDWPIPLALLAFHRALNTRRVRDGVWLGVFVALQALSCLYYAVFLITALAILTVPLLAGRVRSSSSIVALLKPALASVVAFATLVGWYGMQYVQSGRTVGLRSEQDVLDWSPTLRNYIATPNSNWLYGGFTGRFGHLEGILFPGLVALAAAVAGMLPPFNRRRIAYAALLVITFDLSLGFHGFLYRYVYDVLIVYRGLRVPARMFVVVSAAIAVLGGEGVARLLSRVSNAGRRRLVAAALMALVMLESASMPIDLKKVDTPSAVYSWLAKQPPAVVMEWPLPRAAGLGATEAPLFMYFSTFHWQRLVNGYSGFYPPSYIELIETVWSLPSPEAVAYMRQRSVKYLIVHSEPEHDFSELVTSLGNNPNFEPMFIAREDRGVAALYRLR